VFAETPVATVEGFVSATLVKIPGGYAQIETLSVGDRVMSCDFQGHCVERQVIGTKKEEASRYIKILVGGNEISMGYSGRLFSPENSWVNATGAGQVPALMNAAYQSVKVEGTLWIDEPVMLYSLSVEEFQNYFVSGADVLVHNFTQNEVDIQFKLASARDRAQVLIMEQFQQIGGHNPLHLAYMLGTAEHETGNFRHMKEIGGEKKKYARWYGRGYVQLTHKENYEKYSKLLGKDLVSNPDMAMQEEVAAFVLVHGMLTGHFTGKRLVQYIDGDGNGGGTCDFVNARRTVNGIDRAQHIASLAQNWLAYFRKTRGGQYAASLGWLKWKPWHDNC
jgi:predicted chitinase